MQAGRADWSADNIPARAPASHSHTIRQSGSTASRSPRPTSSSSTRASRHSTTCGHDRRSTWPSTDERPPGSMEEATSRPRPVRCCPRASPATGTTAPTATNLARAERLVAASGTRGTLVTVWGWTDDPTLRPPIIRYVAGVLHRLGYVTRVRLVPHAFLDHPTTDVFRSIQLVPAGWADTAARLLRHLVLVRGHQQPRVVLRSPDRRPDSPGAAPAGGQPATRQHRMGTHRPMSSSTWPAWVPIVNERGIDLVSGRVRGYQFHPYWGLIADQLWLA